MVRHVSERRILRGTAVSRISDLDASALAGWWVAAIISLAVFAAVHAYQGVTGMVRSAALGAGLTVIVMVTHSLWPAIVLHSVLDWMGGLTGWLILRDPMKSARDNDGNGAALAE